MLTIEQIKDKMRDRKASKVAKAIGISRQALYLILNGATRPSYDTLQKLSDYLNANT